MSYVAGGKTYDEAGYEIDAFGHRLGGKDSNVSKNQPLSAVAANKGNGATIESVGGSAGPASPASSASMSSLGGAGGADTSAASTMPTTPSASSNPATAMASLMQQAPDPGDVSQQAPGGIRMGLGTRTPAQYNYALASLQRGAY